MAGISPSRVSGSMPRGGLAREPPFRPALLEAPRLAASRLQAPHGVVRIGAERAAAIGHDLTIRRQRPAGRFGLAHSRRIADHGRRQLDSEVSKLILTVSGCLPS